MELVSLKFCGSTIVLVSLASFSKAVMYCSAILSLIAPSAPLAPTDLATVLIPSAVASASLRIDSASPPALFTISLAWASDAKILASFSPWALLIALCFSPSDSRTVALFLLSASLVYFHAATFSGTCAGAALAGIGTGGSVIAWNLWVTKLAPKGMEATYMGAHVAFTGVRGVLAPFLGYWILQAAGFQGVAWVSAALILASSLLFASFLKHPRFHNKD